MVTGQDWNAIGVLRFEKEAIAIVNPYTIIECKGVKIGVLGVVKSDIHDFVLEENIKGIDR